MKEAMAIKREPTASGMKKKLAIKTITLTNMTIIDEIYSLLDRGLLVWVFFAFMGLV